MRKNILTKYFAGALLLFAASACEKEFEPESKVTSFTEYESVPTGGVATVQECGVAVPLHFSFDSEKQLTDISITVSVGESSTAIEGEDFDLVSTDPISVPAYGGQDGFDVEVIVYDDFVIEAGGDETIYLKFESEDPSGLKSTEVLAANIADKGTDVASSDDADFTLSWEYTGGGDACGFDLDLTFQTQNTNPYDDDLMDFGAASLACPESGSVHIPDMVDGYVYDIYVLVYAGEDPALPLTATIDYDRPNSTFSGSFAITGVIDSGMGNDALKVGTIEVNCNKLTIKDLDGGVVGEGRSRPTVEVIHNVVKPF